MPVKLLMTNCQSATDMIAVHGVDKELFQIFKRFEVLPEALAAFRSDTSGALVGEKIAKRYGWKAGQHVTLEELDGVSFNIHGVYEKQGTADDYIILVGRRFLQEAAGEQGVSNHVLVKLKPGADPDAACRDIDALPLTITTTTQPEEAALAAALDQLADLVEVSKFVIGIVLVVILFALGNAISMATRERSTEFGILRTLGFTKPMILSLVLGEGIVQALIGGLLGSLAVQLLISADLIKAISTCGISISLGAGLGVWGVGLTAVCFAGAVGSLVPAWHASRIDIITAIRKRD